jgi:hypothetical protein
MLNELRGFGYELACFGLWLGLAAGVGALFGYWVRTTSVRRYVLQVRWVLGLSMFIFEWLAISFAEGEEIIVWPLMVATYFLGAAGAFEMRWVVPHVQTREFWFGEKEETQET